MSLTSKVVLQSRAKQAWTDVPEPFYPPKPAAVVSSRPVTAKARERPPSSVNDFKVSREIPGAPSAAEKAMLFEKKRPATAQIDRSKLMRKDRSIWSPANEGKELPVTKFRPKTAVTIDKSRSESPKTRLRSPKSPKSPFKLRPGSAAMVRDRPWLQNKEDSLLAAVKGPSFAKTLSGPAGAEGSLFDLEDLDPNHLDRDSVGRPQSQSSSPLRSIALDCRSESQLRAWAMDAACADRSTGRLPFPPPHSYLDPSPPPGLLPLPYLPYHHIQIPSHLPFDDRFIYLAQRVYRARCLDLGVAPSSDQELRFVTLLARGCSPPDVPALSVCGLADLQLGSHAVREVAEFLYFDDRFSTLKLKGNPLGDTGASFVGALLSGNSALTCVDLQATGVGPSGCEALLIGAQSAVALRVLDLSSDQSDGRMTLGEAGTRALSQLVASSSSLRRLKLGNCGLANPAFDLFARALCGAPGLSALDLQANELSPKHVGLLAAGLPQSAGLEELSLANTGLTDYSVLQLEHALRGCESLRVLDLKRNRIRLGGLCLLSDCAGGMPALQTLCLDENLFGEATLLGWDQMFVDDLRRAEEIAARLAVAKLDQSKVSPLLGAPTCTLRRLSLRNCQLGNECVHDLAEVLGPGGLRRLDLSDNLLGDAAAQSLAGLLAVSKTITELDLGRNRVGEEGGMALARALYANPTLTRLGLSANQLRERAAHSLISVLSMARFLYVAADGNAIPYAAFARLQELSLRNRAAYEQGESGRLFEEVQALMRKQVELENTQAAISQSGLELENLQRELHAAQENMLLFKEAQRRATAAVGEKLEDATGLHAKLIEQQHLAEQDKKGAEARVLAQVQVLLRNADTERRQAQQMTKQIEALKQENTQLEEAGDGKIKWLSDLLLKDQGDVAEVSRMLLQQLQTTHGLVQQLKKTFKDIQASNLGGKSRGKVAVAAPAKKAVEKKGGAASKAAAPKKVTKSAKQTNEPPGLVLAAQSQLAGAEIASEGLTESARATLGAVMRPLPKPIVQPASLPSQLRTSRSGDTAGGDFLQVTSGLQGSTNPLGATPAIGSRGKLTTSTVTGDAQMLSIGGITGASKRSGI